MKLLRRFVAVTFAGASAAAIVVQPAHGAEAVPPPRQVWSFAGPFGTYDQGQLQRGFKVFRESCQACHSVRLLKFRNLSELGGPGFTPAQAAAIAAEYQITDGPNDQGEMFQRPGRVADAFPRPFPNDAAARVANAGALPPDLSVITKARGYERGLPWFILDVLTQYQEQGPDYIYALLTGYREAPPDVKLPEGMHYNAYFPGNMIAMPPVLQDGQVTYDDGAPQTVSQYARDVTAFLAWAAEPHMAARKRIGLQVMIFLIVFAVLLYFTKKKVWREVELHPDILRDKS